MLCRWPASNIRSTYNNMFTDNFWNAMCLHPVGTSPPKWPSHVAFIILSQPLSYLIPYTPHILSKQQIRLYRNYSKDYRCWISFFLLKFCFTWDACTKNLFFSFKKKKHTIAETQCQILQFTLVLIPLSQVTYASVNIGISRVVMRIRSTALNSRVFRVCPINWNE